LVHYIEMISFLTFKADENQGYFFLVLFFTEMWHFVFLTQMSVSCWKLITIEQINVLHGLLHTSLYDMLDAEGTLLRIKRALIF